MPDFDFSGLTTRTFEHLVQSIALQEIGGLVTVFGDGKDGGREATFEGATDFSPSGGASGWDGYGVIQAKFRQRLGDSKSNGDWALNSLRKELAEFDKGNSPRRLPDYYIYATNVVLTPVEETGSKDKVLAELRNWCAKRGLKGFALWDFDQLSTYLSLHEGIRRNYAAWITPGDVLARLAEWVEYSRPDFPAIASQYLQKELLQDQFANLEQGGHSPDDKIPLANIFVDLPVSEVLPLESGNDPEGSAGQAEGQANFIETVISETDDFLDEQAAAVVQGREPGAARRMVLLGGPGQGKTTVSQYLCQMFRVALLRGQDSSQLLPEVLTEVDSICGQAEAANMRIPGCRRFPLRIVLSEFASALAKDSSGELSILRYLTTRFNKRANADLSANDLILFLKNYPSILVLDGLDEVPNSSNRDDVMKCIQEFEIDARVAGLDTFVLVTTRPQGYNDDLSRKYYRHRALVPLDPSHAMAYAERLVHVRFGGDPARAGRIRTRLEAATFNQATLWLMRSPLQVTIMVLLVDQVGHPPEERWALFSQYYELICRRELERDIPTSAVIRKHRLHIDTVHRRVGLILQTRSEVSGGTDARLTSDEFSRIVKSYLAEEEFSPAEAETLALDIETAAAHRLVFLVGLEEGQVGFEVRSLQEFMAAEALLDGADAQVISRLTEIAHIDHWENVLLFAVGKCFKERTYLRDAVVSICRGLDDDPSDPLSMNTLVGARLALAILQDGAPNPFPKYSRQLARCAVRLLDSPHTGYGVSLASIYSDATGEIIDHELQNAIAIPRYHSSRFEAWAAVCRLTATGLWSSSAWSELVGKHPNLLDGGFYWTALHANSGQRSLAPLLQDGLLRQSPLSILRRLDGPEGEKIIRDLAEASADGAIVAAASVLSHLRLRGRRSAQVSMTDWSIRVNIRLVAGRDEVIEGDPEALDPYPGWKFLTKIAEFSASPSKETLALLLDSSLHLARDTDSTELFEYGSLLAPWPFSMCYPWGDTAAELEHVAAMVRTGELGDTPDWLAAQTSWLKDGCDLEESIEGMLSERSLKLRANVLPSQLLTTGVSIHLLRPEVVDRAVDKLLWYVDTLDDVRARNAVFDIACQIVCWPFVMPHAEDRSIRALIALVEHVPEVRDSRYFWLVQQALSGLSPIDLHVLSPQFVEGLVALANEEVQYVSIPLSFERLIRDALAADAGRVGLLYWVACAAPHGRPFAPFDAEAYLRRPEIQQDEALMWHLRVIRARQRGLLVEEVAEVAETADEERSDWLDWYLDAGKEGCAEAKQFESFLIALRSHLKDKPSCSDIVFEQMVTVVESRTSCLSSAEDCARLGLPVAVVT